MNESLGGSEGGSEGWRSQLGLPLPSQRVSECLILDATEIHLTITARMCVRMNSCLRFQTRTYPRCIDSHAEATPVAQSPPSMMLHGGAKVY